METKYRDIADGNKQGTFQAEPGTFWSDTKYRDTADRNTIPFLDSTQSAFSLEAKYDDIADGATKQKSARLDIEPDGFK